MDLLASTGAPLLLVNLVFAAIALAVGFAAGAWVCGTKTPTDAAEATGDEDAVSPQEQQLVMERTMLASDRLRDLAASVASDVGTHNASIGAIEAQLEASRAAGDPSAELVISALAEIGQANESLQSKLVKAEQQIQAQAEQIRTHESEARTDSLTGLANRRAFDDELARRFAEWERYRTPFSLLILDVDHFKRFNDTHGHQAGDEVLRKVAEAISHCAREMDLPCRYGGEEFAVILPATEAVDGSVLAERVRTTIEAMQVPFEGKQLSVTTSLGLSGCLAGDDTSRLVKRADEALYVSKDAGRNNGHRHTGETCVPITPGKAAEASAAAEATAEESPQTMLESLPNRTRFLELLRTEVRVAQDTGSPIALLAAEFESYGRLKDEFGVAVADLTLDSIAQFLANAIHEEDWLGRLSESRFVVLLPGKTAAAAQQVGSRINAALKSCSVPLGDSQLQLTTAMSVTELKVEDTAVTLMQRTEGSIGVATSEIEAPAAV